MQRVQSTVNTAARELAMAQQHRNRNDVGPQQTTSSSFVASLAKTRDGGRGFRKVQVLAACTRDRSRTSSTHQCYLPLPLGLTNDGILARNRTETAKARKAAKARAAAAHAWLASLSLLHPHVSLHTVLMMNRLLSQTGPTLCQLDIAIITYTHTRYTRRVILNTSYMAPFFFFVFFFYFSFFLLLFLLLYVYREKIRT